MIYNTKSRDIIPQPKRDEPIPKFSRLWLPIPIYFRIIQNDNGQRCGPGGQLSNDSNTKKYQTIITYFSFFARPRAVFRYLLAPPSPEGVPSWVRLQEKKRKLEK